MSTFVLSRVLLAALAAAVLVAPGAAQDKPKPAQPKKPTVMQRKLLHAQKILESLALNEFAKMESSAEELQLCAKEGVRALADLYRVYSPVFLKIVNALSRVHVT